MLRMGTMITYRAVRKPAFAVVVVAMPICWAAEAMNRKNPQRSPPVISVRRSPLPAEGRSVFRRITATRGRRATPASQLRLARKVKAPTLSAPTLWATNAAPQIMAVRSRRRVLMISLDRAFCMIFLL